MTTIHRVTLGMLAGLASVACAGPAVPATDNFAQSSVPWDAPPEDPIEVVANRDVDVPRHGLELIPRGVQPVERTDREVVLLSVVEVVNHEDRPMDVPPLDVVAQGTNSEGESTECPPTTTPGESQRPLAPGERRMVWVRSTCELGEDSQLLRVSATIAGEVAPPADLGEVILAEEGIDTSATAER